MTTEDSTLREVDQELAEERQQELFRKYGPFLIGAAALLVVGVGGWQFYTARKAGLSDAGAMAYQQAIETLQDSPEEGRNALSEITDGPSAGYAALAALEQAASLAQAGETAQAYSLYQTVINLNGVTPHIQDLARLRAAYLSLDNADRDQVLLDLADLPQKETAMGFYAREVVALAALAAKDYDPAITEFQALADNLTTPPLLRQRAGEFAILARSGNAGANLTGEARVEDLLDALGEPASAPLPGIEEALPAASSPPSGGNDTAETQGDGEINQDTLNTGDADPKDGQRPQP